LLLLSVVGGGSGKGEGGNWETKRVDRVVLDFAAAVREEAGREVDVARVGLYAGCGLAYAGLVVVLACDVVVRGEDGYSYLLEGNGHVLVELGLEYCEAFWLGWELSGDLVKVAG
jgi:hypothetical protein